MPQGKPNYLEMVNYPMIKQLVHQNGMPMMHKVLFLLVKDFCASMNVVRNMNEEQMIESASMLLDECGNFRLEDYVMMFQMAKRGDLVKIMDRIDMQKITEMLDEYWKRRHDAGNKAIDEENRGMDMLGDTKRTFDKKQIFNHRTGQYEYEQTISDKVSSLGESISELNMKLKEETKNSK